MREKFSFNSQEYDFWDIYDTIKKYYPIGIHGINNVESLYYQYPGGEGLRTLIEENFVNKKNYKERWLTFKNYLKEEIKKPVIDTFTLFSACYSGFVQIKRIKKDELIRQKELHFSISLLGPYYTIFGLDKTSILLQDEYLFDKKTIDATRFYDATHAVTVSPFKEYEDIFLLLKNRICVRFAEYKFVPYQINKMCLEGMKFESPIHKGSTDETIYGALFNHCLDINAIERGDRYYGYEDWLKKG